MTRQPCLSVRTAWLAASALAVFGCTQVPTPLIDDLVPNGALVGSPGFVLTIFGRNFEPEATVSFGGMVKETTDVGENQLDISVDASEVAAPGQISVVVTNPDRDFEGDESSTSMTFTVHPITELRVEAQPDVALAPDGKPVYATTELGALTATAIGGGGFFSRDVTLEADWSSSDDGVATVSDGLVGPQAEGAVTVDALPGIGTNMLADRLKTLASDGLITQRTLPPPAGVSVYELTEAGQSLEPVLLELVRWGMRHQRKPKKNAVYRPTWAIVAMRALFRPERATGLEVTCEFRVGDETFHARGHDGELHTEAGPASEPDVCITTTPAVFRRFESGEGPAALKETGKWRVEGTESALERFVGVFGSAPRSRLPRR